MTALNGRLADLARWSEVESPLVNRLESVLTGPPRDNQGTGSEPARPVDWSLLMRGYAMLVREFGLPDDLIESPSFAVCNYKYYRNPDPPEFLLLNSFFLGDLAFARRLVSSGQVPLSLARYLGLKPPTLKQDVLKSQAALLDAVSPKLTPPSRWPGPGRKPLVLLQQAAVNLAAKELQNGGLLGVNGPPGTGKTTLLRDVVAHVVAARAEAMSCFDDPASAFTASDQRINVGGGSWLNLHRLCPTVRGYELLAATSNNKAVENISRELPAIGAIAADAVGLRYFQSLSDSVHECPTWGLIAAVLGNSENRFRFREVFWNDEDVGMSGYLAAAAGTPQQIEQRDPETGVVTFRQPRLIASESPPTTHEEGLTRWRKARGKFREAVDRFRSWQQLLVTVEQDVSNLPRLKIAESTASCLFTTATTKESGCREIWMKAKATASTAENELAQTTAAMSAHVNTRPNLLSRLFGTKSAKTWQKADTAFRATLKQREDVLAAASVDLIQREAEHKQAIAEIQARQSEWKKATETRIETEKRIGDARKNGTLLLDEAFFQRSHSDKHLCSPWFPDKAHVVRDEVFQSALDLHRAFINVAAKPIRHNLAVLMKVMGGSRLRTSAQEALLADLWSTLFLVVPLISTTFASVERMLGRLPSESLGWLLVDEGGQALPQSAVGALIRTRRALIVGDPVQIEPVVSLPDQLTRAISLQMGVDPDRFAAPIASVQTLADAASSFESELQTENGSRVAGIPLLVHRRCTEPMFGVANAIAYGGMMVSAKNTGPSSIRDILGPSTWLHVEGSAEHHWCEDEGKIVLDLLRQLANAGVQPDLFILSPFVAVAQRLREMIHASGLTEGWPIDGGSRRWTESRIGTVHTAQGREAEAVILVLGAPLANQAGARNWAGVRPNLLNVALTRAKEVIYVIGNRNLWSEAGVFRKLAARL
ncbi:DEAD/DEAH box helicase [Fimbriiglobus ruber]|nr:AAA domain-containing protein [Fimbriiglobus ruber]